MLQSAVFLARTKPSLAGAATSIIFVETRLLLLQMYACRDRHFCRDKHVFVTTKLLSRQAYFCGDKQTIDMFCRDKHVFVATKILEAAAANDTKRSGFRGVRNWFAAIAGTSPSTHLVEGGEAELQATLL